MSSEFIPSSKNVNQLFEAIFDVFPMILSANLSQNTYFMYKHDNFLVDDIPETGNYDEMIQNSLINIHPDYQSDFLRLFSRERLLEAYARGITDVYAELYQKGRNSDYQWVSTHVIRTTNQNGDICQICINRIMNDVNQINMVEKHL